MTEVSKNVFELLLEEATGRSVDSLGIKILVLMFALLAGSFFQVATDFTDLIRLTHG